MDNQRHTSYQSFSGADIIATFGGQVIAELLSITWSVTREKAPNYCMGDPNPKGFSRGKRGIAGSLVMAVFNRNALIEELKHSGQDRLSKYYTFVGANGLAAENQRFNSVAEYNEFMQAVVNTGNGELLEAAVRPVEIKYADQILPFNITINFANEYGERCKMALIDVEIMNEGMGVSIDDLSTSQNYTYVARDIQILEGTIPSKAAAFSTLYRA